MRFALLANLAFLLLLSPACADVISGDGAWIARLEDGGHVLVILDAASGDQAHRRELTSRHHVATAASAVIAFPVRRSILVALEGVPELWEIALFPEAGPFHDGFVHSYEKDMEEGLAAEQGLFARQRILLEAPLVALTPDPAHKFGVIGTRADGTRVAVNLAVRREVAVLPPG